MEERMETLSGRRAIITAAAPYIERARTLMLSQECTNLTITRRIKKGRRQETGEIIGAGGRCTFFQAAYIPTVSVCRVSA